MGAGGTYIPDLNQKPRLEEILGNTPYGTFKKFRIKIGEQMFHSKAYSRAAKRNSYTVLYEKETGKDEAYGQIQFYLQHHPPACMQSEFESAAVAVIWKLQIRQKSPFQDIGSDVVASHIQAVSYPR